MSHIMSKQNFYFEIFFSQICGITSFSNGTLLKAKTKITHFTEKYIFFWKKLRDVELKDFFCLV